MNNHRVLTGLGVFLACLTAWTAPPATRPVIDLAGPPLPVTQPADPKADTPRPDIWEKYPALKETLDADLEKMKTYLKALEPEAFAARHGELARMARSKDADERKRALAAIAALQDTSGLPFLVEPAQQGGGDANLEPMMHLGHWVYNAYHPARKPPEKFVPLLPLFVKTLVEAGDAPNVRAYCFQGIGSLAGPEWLPLVKDLSGTRHPAVTHWSGWAIQQIGQRAPATQPASGPATRPDGQGKP